MPTESTHAGYEFNEQQSALFSKLSAAMMFVCLTIIFAGGLLFVPAYTLLRGAARNLAPLLFLVPGGTLVIMGVHLYGAVSHFKRIATTRGNDIENLMVAIEELTKAYTLQRWLWIVIVMSVAVALLETTATS